MEIQELVRKSVGVLVTLLQVTYWYLEAIFRKIVPPPMKSIDGETILVTGAAGAIGKEICRHLVRSGSNLKLVLWDVNMGQLDKLASELKGLKGDVKVYTFEVDISSKDNIEAGCLKVKETVGPVTIIFNNAGILHIGNFLEQTKEQIEAVMNVNLMSHIWIIREFLLDMVQRNHGRIVCTASMTSLKATSHTFPYVTSKYAVNGLMEALKTELSVLNCNGIHCTTVYPYFVKTPLIKPLSFDSTKATNLLSTFQKFLEPSEVAIPAVDGMRREYELVYCPSTVPIVTFFADYLMPRKLWTVLRDTYFLGFMNDDKEEHQRLQTPYEIPEKKKN